jgi:histidinol-phosphatase (PHP family)
MALRACDYHVHSTNSGDCFSAMPDVCEAAVRAGLSELAFTEHVDFEFSDPNYGTFDYGRYMKDIAVCRSAYEGRLRIWAGVEVDYQVSHRHEIEDFLGRRTFDYVLGAVHYVDGVILSMPSDYFSRRTEEDAYGSYFDLVRTVISTGLFDAIAHLDICKRYGCLHYGAFDPEKYMGNLETVLLAAIANDVVLEINTSGLRQSPLEPFPGDGVLKAYSRLGGRFVVVGSDAHTPGDVGTGVAGAYESAAGAGLEVIRLGSGFPRRHAGCGGDTDQRIA